MEVIWKDRRGRPRIVSLAAVVVLAMVVVGVVAACGNGDEKPTSTGETAATDGADGGTPEPTEEDDGEILGPIDPCGLVTKEEAEAALGTTLGKTRKGNSAPYDVCAYEATDSEAKAVVHVRSDLPDGEFEGEKARTEALLGETSEAVSGVGDEAHYLGHLLYVRKGDREIIMGVILAADNTSAQVLAIEKDLTLKALARLP